jgi:hypothetical protein
MDDDDEMRPNHLELLLEAVRKDHLELVYGSYLTHLPDRPAEVIRAPLPPKLNGAALTTALMHADLRFFEYELAAAAFGLPVDWLKVLRMWRAGVRIGVIDDVVLDHFASMAQHGTASPR